MMAMAAVSALLIGIGEIYVIGVDGDRLKETETLHLLGETAALFAVLFLTLSLIRRRAACALLLGAVSSVFLWLHQAFLPVLASGLYLCALVGTGQIFLGLLDRKRQLAPGHLVTWMASLILGCGLTILLFCAMSLLGVGGIGNTRAAAVILFLAAGFRWVQSLKTKEGSYRLQKLFHESGRIPPVIAGLLAFILAMLLLQAGRMNLCIDYDSLHYSLRSQYILDNGGGIYENLGSVNVVYTYSKGLEILLLPLSGLPSHSFFLAFQLWFAAGILIVCHRIVTLFVSRRLGILYIAV